MSYYDNSSWPAPGRQPSWEQQPPPSRSGASSAVHGEEASAFRNQFEEVERAQDNLVKSGKMFPAPGGRRDSMPSIPGGRGYPELDPRMGGAPQRHSVSEYDGMRSNSVSNVQGYYANQRYQPRHNDPDQMMQAKRRMAAQRERELRNYHQEQQYNRSVLADVSASASKSDRPMSPNTMSEDERRELIARQHRALYGDNSSLYNTENTTNRQSSQDARVSLRGGSRGNSPLAYDPFGMQNSTGSIEPAVQMPTRDQMQGKDNAAGGAQQRSRANSTSSPSSNQNASFALFDAQQSSRTSTSSPGGSPPRQGAKAASGNPAPIGTRPAVSQGPGAGSLQKRSTTPLPSPLSFGYSAAQQQNNQNERSNSASSNPPSAVADKGVGLGWGSNSGVWGGKSTLGVQASVWG